jgi:hypothetical protein
MKKQHKIVFCFCSRKQFSNTKTETGSPNEIDVFVCFFVLSYFRVLIGDKFKSSKVYLKRLIEEVPAKRKADKS